jgi:tetratricopeptide (TPR) repeat protein
MKNFTLRPLLVLSGLVVGCAEEQKALPSSSAAPTLAATNVASSTVETAPTLAMPQGNVKTTSPTIALSNLDGQIRKAEEDLAKTDSTEKRAHVFGLVGARFQVTGKLDDYSRMLKVSDVKLGERATFDEVMLFARGRSAAHEFEEALTALDRAKSLASKEQVTSVTSKRATVLLALGRYEEALPLAETIARVEPSLASFADQGAILAAMGEVAAAEKIFVQAETLYRSVSPFPLAHLYFDRGQMFEKSGDLASATALYQAALKRLPEHAHAAVHLAPLLPPSEGIALLDRVAAGTDSADVFAQRGVLANIVAKGTGDADLAKAQQLYDEAMNRHPKAFADHAGWFYVNVVVDPRKALAAAKLNVATRKTSDSLELLLAAAELAKDDAELCAARDLAEGLEWKTPRLQSRLATTTCTRGAAPPSASAQPRPSAPKP